MKNRLTIKMWEIALSLLVILTMTAFLIVQITRFESYAAEQEGGIVEVVQEEEETIPAASLDEPEVLLEQYIEEAAITHVEEAMMGAATEDSQSNLPKVGARYWRLGDPERKAYLEIKKMLQQIASGDEKVAEITLTYADLFTDEVLNARYTAADLGVSDLTDGKGSISNEAFDALKKKYRINTGSIMSALSRDCPELLYWFDKTIGMKTGLGYDVFGVHENGELVIYCTAEKSYYSFGFSVSSDYAVAENGQVVQYAINIGLLESVNKALNNAAQIVTDARSSTDYEKLAAYKNKICAEVTYNSTASNQANNIAYGNPWQLIYVFDKDPATNVVCEGYSKAFKFLCDLSSFSDKSINCSLVTGEMSGGKGAGGHMWNVVSVGGYNYLVDVTNCDAGTIGAPDKLFMVGTASDENNSEQYTFPFEDNRKVIYIYDKDTTSMFDQSERQLATSNYTAGASESGDNNDNPGGNNDNPGDNTDNPGTDDPNPDPEPEPEPEPEPQPIDISGALDEVSIPSFTYTGSAIKPSVTIYESSEEGDRKLVSGTDYTVEYKNNTSVGTATMTITGIGNYTGTITKTFAIKVASIEKATVTGIAAKTYTGKGLTQAPTVKLGTLTLKSGTHYTLSYTNNTKAGTATVKIAGKGNYTGSISKSFKINPKSVTPSVKLSATAYTYDGKVKAPGVTVKYGSLTLKKGTDYKVTYAAGRKDVGTYKVTVTLINNYKGSKAVNFVINPKGASIGTPVAASKAITVRWGKQAAKMSKKQITGYQVQLSTVKTFKSGIKTKNVAGVNKTSVKITGLKSKATYYIRVRTYMKVGSKTYYSGWSKVKSAKAK